MRFVGLLGALVLMAVVLWPGKLGHSIGHSSSTTIPNSVVRLAIFEDSVREFLAQTWDSAYASPSGIREMGLCLRAVYPEGHPTLWIVQGARVGETDSSAYNTVRWRCDNNEILLHTHPPYSCTDLVGRALNRCIRGGWWGYQCAPSYMDLSYIPANSEDFRAVQCDRHAVVFYRPLMRSDVPGGTR